MFALLDSIFDAVLVNQKNCSSRNRTTVLFAYMLVILTVLISAANSSLSDYMRKFIFRSVTNLYPASRYILSIQHWAVVFASFDLPDLDLKTPQPSR
jgi:hypothetical protein